MQLYEITFDFMEFYGNTNRVCEICVRYSINSI